MPASVAAVSSRVATTGGGGTGWGSASRARRAIQAMVTKAAVAAIIASPVQSSTPGTWFENRYEATARPRRRPPAAGRPAAVRSRRAQRRSPPTRVSRPTVCAPARLRTRSLMASIGPGIDTRTNGPAISAAVSACLRRRRTNSGTSASIASTNSNRECTVSQLWRLRVWPDSSTKSEPTVGRPGCCAAPRRATSQTPAKTTIVTSADPASIHQARRVTNTAAAIEASTGTA